MSPSFRGCWRCPRRPDWRLCPPVWPLLYLYFVSGFVFQHGCVRFHFVSICLPLSPFARRLGCCFPLFRPLFVFCLSFCGGVWVFGHLCLLSLSFSIFLNLSRLGLAVHPPLAFVFRLSGGWCILFRVYAGVILGFPFFFCLIFTNQDHSPLPDAV